MRIVLFNSLKCELAAWSSVEDFTAELLRGEIDFCHNDTLLFQDEEEQGE